jgi:hypothetical protein
MTWTREKWREAKWKSTGIYISLQYRLAGERVEGAT